MPWLRIALLVALALIATYGVAFAVGAARWKAATEALRARLIDAQRPAQTKTVDFGELADLPTPVQHYLRTVLQDGQPVVMAARMRHTGTFNMSETAEQWKPFTSEQWVTTERPGFLWNGRVRVLPGLPARVHDAYVAGTGVLHVSILGLADVADLRGGGELAAGELMRYLAEATWYPTALLPSQGVTWEAVDARSARATLANGDAAVTLRFTFDDRGLVHTVEADARGRTVNGQIVPTPWRGRFWAHEEREGMLVPTEGEVGWVLPEGEQLYWQGRITTLEYDWTGE